MTPLFNRDILSNMWILLILFIWIFIWKIHKLYKMEKKVEKKFLEGYQPLESTIDTEKPPQGGTGVPDVSHSVPRPTLVEGNDKKNIKLKPQTSRPASSPPAQSYVKQLNWPPAIFCKNCGQTIEHKYLFEDPDGGTGWRHFNEDLSKLGGKNYYYHCIIDGNISKNIIAEPKFMNVWRTPSLAENKSVKKTTKKRKTTRRRIQ